MLDIQTSSMMNPRFSMLSCMETFGERLARLRTLKGLSQAELARRVGVSRSAINQIESGGSKNTTPGVMLRMAEELDVDPHELTFGEKTALEAWDRAVFKVIDDLPETTKQEVLDFVLYKVERAENLIASEKLPQYLDMIRRIRADMNAKKGRPSES